MTKMEFCSIKNKTKLILIIIIIINLQLIKMLLWFNNEKFHPERFEIQFDKTNNLLMDDMIKDLITTLVLSQ